MTIKSLSPIFFGLLVVLSLTIVTTQVDAQQGTTVNGDCVQASDFLDVQAVPQNSQYPAPTLTVDCQGDVLVVTSNAIPNYEFLSITPNGLSTHNLSVEIPLNPMVASQPTDIPLLGTVAVAVNGLPIFGPNEGGNSGFGDPMLDNILDFCNGHVGPSGYHLHASPTCLFDNYQSAGLVIGYALDGFPILAPYVCADDGCSSVVEVMSSWQRTSNVVAAWDAHEYVAGSGDLDQCNGMYLDDGSYAYFATNSFPYVLSCYTGVVDITQAGEQGAPNGQGGNTGEPPTGQGGDDGNRPPRGQGRGGN